MEKTNQTLVSLIESINASFKSDQLKLNYFTYLLLNNYLSTSNDVEKFFNEMFDKEFEERFSIIANINNALGDDLLYHEMYKIILDRYGEHKITEQFQILLTWHEFKPNDFRLFYDKFLFESPSFETVVTILSSDEGKGVKVA